MKNNNIVSWLIIISLFFIIVGCARERIRDRDIAIRINEFVMTAGEFEDEFQDSSYSAGEKNGREQFLEDLISRKLLLQEAERMGLDKDKGFLKEIERFWEKTLLKYIIDRKSNEFAGRVSVQEDDILSRYNEMVKRGLVNSPLEELYDHIKWLVLREKQTEAFNAWLRDLRRKARLEVDKELLGIQ